MWILFPRYLIMYVQIPSNINNLKLETPLIRDTQPEYKVFLIKKKCNKLHYQSLHV